uniref:Septin-type G domain-containing protein n=1 Tax=Hucho hucho TaxID=62062 RepID=A0A4W5KX80_9TELE
MLSLSSLRPLDVEFMSRLSKVVNIVPVITKADTLTLEERDFFKQTIREGLRANGIDVYPQEEFDEDSDQGEFTATNRPMHGFIINCVYVSSGDDPICCGGERPGVPGQWKEASR